MPIQTTKTEETPKVTEAKVLKNAAEISGQANIKSETDKKPFVTSAKAEDVKLKVLTEADILDESIEAKPFQMPEMLNVKLKDKSWTPRWINRKSQSGSWLQRWVAMGFVKVYPDEIEGAPPVEVSVGRDEITQHDVILMKCNTVQMLQALKYNLEKSQQMVSPKNAQDKAFNQALQQLRSDLGGSVPYEATGKVNFYKPSAAEAEAKNA